MKTSKNSKTDRIGVQIVGEQFERSGYIFREQPIRDYGIDAHVELVDEDNPTGKLIALQIKSGMSWFREQSEDFFIFRGDKKHLNYWLDHSLPVLVVLCDIESRQCYWQSITTTNVIPTEKAWKIHVPKYQRINPGMDVDLKRLVRKLPVHKDYTVCSISDVSHGAAKRYSLKIVLNREYTQAEAIDLIKKLTLDTANCEYHRSDITRAHWRDQPAHVVWLYVYPSSEDERNNNFIAQSEWFSETLKPAFLPASNGGEEISSNLRVLWNDGYLIASRFNDKHTINKEEFIRQVVNLSDQTKSLIVLAEEALECYLANKISFENLQVKLKDKFKKIDDIYRMGINIGLSPYECKDISIKFQSLIAHAHNVYLPFSDIGKGFEKEQTVFNIKSQTKHYHEALAGFEYELKKIQ